MTELEVNLKQSIIHLFLTRNEKLNESVIGAWGSKHCDSFLSTELLVGFINVRNYENVFNIEIIGYLTKSYPAIKLFFIVANHSFHTEQSLKANITELYSN